MDGYNIKATTACQRDRVHGISHLPKNKAFAVSVMNMTFRPLSYGRMRDAEDEDWGPWLPVPVVPQNCFGDPKDCFEEGQWTTIFSVDAEDTPFQLQLVTEPDENGNAFGGDWRVTPTRDTIGQVLVASH